MALKPEDLKVESFATTPDLTDKPVLTNEPTPATHCFWCPPGTADCL